MLLLYITLYNSVKRYKENNRYCPTQPTTRSSSNSLFMMLHTKIRQRELVDALFNLGLCISQSLAFVQSLKSIIDLEGLDNQEVWALILKLDDSLNTASKVIKQQNKLIRITDKSEAAQAAVDEYLTRLLWDPKMKRRSVLLSRELWRRRKMPGLLVWTEVKYFFFFVSFHFAHSLSLAVSQVDNMGNAIPIPSIQWVHCYCSISVFYKWRLRAEISYFQYAV